LADQPRFAPRGSTQDIEEGLALAPKFDADGLVTCVASDARSGEVLMVAHMNAEALARTIASVVEMRLDCDQDAVWIKVEQAGGGACHTGRRSCFYRAVPLGSGGEMKLEFRDSEKAFDPQAVYGDKPKHGA